MSKRAVGFIGLGVMGEPICRNICAGGYAVTAYDLDAAPLDRLAGHGVQPADRVGAVIRHADVVFASLPSGRVLEAVVREKDGVLENLHGGHVFVDLGTSPVALTRTLADEFARRGARYLDAPVARTRQAAEQGTLSVMVGGDANTFAEVQPIMACFASDITHCGPVGNGQVTKILNNMVLFETVAALSEAYAIARRSGLDPALLFETLSRGSADSFALRNHGMKAILPQQFPERAFSVEYAKKDLAYALELALETGVDAEGARRVDRLFEQAIAHGFGDQYHPVVSRVINRE
jgi:3-hydroxyisobutyrate dehydrogenase-like beta-hydroxyacid dehydrogenase